MKFWIGLLIGVGVASALAGELPKTLYPGDPGWINIPFENAVNIGFDPDGHGKSAKFDKDGNVMAHCVP